MYLKQTALLKSKASFCKRPNKTIAFFSSYLKLYSQKAPPPFATSSLLSYVAQFGKELAIPATNQNTG